MSIELKRVTKDDLEILINWRMKPEITKYMYTDPVLDIEKQIKWYEKIKNENNSKYWIIYYNNQRIGEISIQNIDYINRKCSWAYSIGEDSARGIGLGKTLECNIYDYVFCNLKLNKLCCEVFQFNQKVVSLHEKFGSEIEGVLKEHILKNNIYYDVVVMGIVKKKWDLIKKKYEYTKISIEE